MERSWVEFTPPASPPFSEFCAAIPAETNCQMREKIYRSCMLSHLKMMLRGSAEWMFIPISAAVPQPNILWSSTFREHDLVSLLDFCLAGFSVSGSLETAGSIWILHFRHRIAVGWGLNVLTYIVTPSYHEQSIPGHDNSLTTLSHPQMWWRNTPGTGDIDTPVAFMLWPLLATLPTSWGISISWGEIQSSIIHSLNDQEIEIPCWPFSFCVKYASD